VFGTQVSHQLGNLLFGDRVAEWGHLLSAVENLVGDSGRRPELVLAQVYQGRRFFGADAALAMAVSAAFVAKQDRAGLFVGLGPATAEGAGRDCGKKGEGQQKGRDKRNDANDHGIDFLMAQRGRLILRVVQARAALRREDARDGVGCSI